MARMTELTCKLTCVPLLCGVIFLLGSTACTNTSAKVENTEATPAPLSLPVMTVRMDSTSSSKDYTAALEGKVNVEIRSQVDGYLDKIFVDEGSYVKKGQDLFKINDHTYQEQLNTAIANLHMAQANMSTAQIEVDKLTPLVRNNVVSEIQLKAANSAYDAAKASVEQARAAIASAKINLGFTLIQAPVSGYIGRIPKRLGTLVSKNDAQGITTLSDIEEIFAYFSLSESDFLYFNAHNKGNSLEEKIRQLRPVSLVLADGSIYQHPGKVDIVNGQFDKTTGAIVLRATFPNPEKLLRTGNSGKIRMEEFYPHVMLLPVSATVDQQDKIFVYALSDSNRVKRVSITVTGKSGTNYIVSDGVQPGDRIVTAGLDNLQEGTAIMPQDTLGARQGAAMVNK